MNEIYEWEALRSSLLTAELNEGETQALADRMGVTTLSDGEVLVAEGDQCKTLFLQAAGAIQLYRDRAGDELLADTMLLDHCATPPRIVDWARG